MSELSIIIPFCNEWPVIPFTVRSIYEELKDRVDFEIVVVDNYVPKEMGKRKPDKAHAQMRSESEHLPWLRYLKYPKKLSHWNAKNHAVQHSDSPFIMFCDAHVLPARDSLYNLFTYYKENWEQLQGSIHPALTYHIIEGIRLKYIMKRKKDPKNLHYAFERFTEPTDLFEVPCMSTCGMLIHRDYLTKIGLWPTEYGIYGGGEDFYNFAGATLGLKKWIYPQSILHHHGDDRGYNWNDKDWIRNRAIAVYMYGGYQMCKEYCVNFVWKGQPNLPRYPQHLLYHIFSTVVDAKANQKHRELIKSRQVFTIEEWLKNW
jgi:glycosyltransferase involved in cell wall biosynthesis